MTELNKSANNAMLKAQQSMTSVLKQATNPYYKSKYADLVAVMDVLKEPLNANGFIITQPIEMIENQWCVVTRLIHADSGMSIESAMPIKTKDIDDPQKWGSAITYARRYTLQSLIALPADKETEDDGNGASAPKPKAKPEPPTKKPADTDRDKAKDALWQAAKKYLHGDNDAATLDNLDKFAVKYKDVSVSKATTEQLTEILNLLEMQNENRQEKQA